MEKNDTDLLREIEETLSTLKQRIQEVEEQLAALRAKAVTEEPVDFTTESFGVEPLPEQEAVPVVSDEAPVDIEVPEEPVDIDIPEVPPVIPVPEAASVIPASEDTVVIPSPEGASESPAVPVIPQDVARLPWRTARPGLPVKHIRSGISLLDRAQFVGVLFKEDAALYNQTLTELDELENLDQATDYVLRHFPDWDLGSNIVYSFMMAVRKRLG